MLKNNIAIITALTPTNVLGFGSIKHRIMIYLVENKRSGEFHFAKSIQEIIESFPILTKKSETIKNRFRELKKQNTPIKFYEWGFIFKAEKK